MNASTNNDSFKVFLSYSAHDNAEKKSKEISNIEKARQAYLNYLAVYAVDYYLRCMGFKTVKDEAIHNPWMLSFVNAANLEVKNIGTLECCPVLHNAEYFEIPAEVMSDRIGYIAVQLSESLKEANILGFTTQPLAKVYLNQLHSVDDLLEYFTQKEQTAIVNIHQWMEGIITVGWQTIDELFNPQELNYRFARNLCITRGKKIDLGLQFNGTSVALIVKLASENQEEIKNQKEIDIVVQVHPLSGVYLPQGLDIIVIDAQGEPVLNTTSREKDNWVEVNFSAESGEKFSIDVCLNDSKVSQEFVV
jgi:Protein of unknown function (DUF1822)